MIVPQLFAVPGKYVAKDRILLSRNRAGALRIRGSEALERRNIESAYLLSEQFFCRAIVRVLEFWC